MLLHAYVLGEVPGSNSTRWYVNIPVLYGRPDNIVEKAYVDSFNSTPAVSVSKTVSLIDLFFNSFNKSATEESLGPVMPLDPNFNIEAGVCTLPNTKIYFTPGELVIVGFLENDIGKPIILGSFVQKSTSVIPTLTLSLTNQSKVSMLLELLNVSYGATLPLATTTKFNSTNSTFSFDAVDIKNCVASNIEMQENSISVADLLLLKNAVDKLLALIQ